MDKRRTAKDTRVLGVIPARWGAKRLPGKSLRTICGRPLIHWVVLRARRAVRLGELIVATDDERIAGAVRELGVEAVMTRPDHPSGTDRVAEAVAGRSFDVVVNIQGDEPLIEPALIDRLARALLDHPDWDMSTAAAAIRDGAELQSPSAVKVVCDARGLALYFSRLPIPCVRDGQGPLPGLHWRHVGIYGYRRSFLERVVAEPPCPAELAEGLEQLRALHIGGRIHVLRTEDRGIGVDTPEDLVYVEKVMRESGLGAT